MLAGKSVHPKKPTLKYFLAQLKRYFLTLNLKMHISPHSIANFGGKNILITVY